MLALLALRDWTAYELVQQVRRNAHLPGYAISERQLYDEPGRLVARGWAEVMPAPRGRRARAAYRITEAGRAALREWLASPAAPPTLQLEALIRVAHADQGSKQDLLNVLHNLREYVRRTRVSALVLGRSQQTPDFPFADRLHLISLYGEFVIRWLDLLDNWAVDALAEVESWPSTQGVGRTQFAEDGYARFYDRMRALGLADEVGEK